MGQSKTKIIYCEVVILECSYVVEGIFEGSICVKCETQPYYMNKNNRYIDLVWNSINKARLIGITESTIVYVSKIPIHRIIASRTRIKNYKNNNFTELKFEKQDARYKYLIFDKDMCPDVVYDEFYVVEYKYYCKNKYEVVNISKFDNPYKQ